jgi:hypothetical protein
LAAAALSVEVAGRFCEARRAAGYTKFVSMRGVGPLLGYLRREGVIGLEGTSSRLGPVDALLDRFTTAIARASIVRAGHIYATGSFRARKLTLHAVRAIGAGSYKLTLRSVNGEHRVIGTEKLVLKVAQT